MFNYITPEMGFAVLLGISFLVISYLIYLVRKLRVTSSTEEEGTSQSQEDSLAVVDVPGVKKPRNGIASHAVNLTWGLLMSMLISTTILFPVWYVLSIFATEISSSLLAAFGFFLAFFSITAFAFVEGFHDTEIRHVSVPRFLGRRLPGWKLLDEGKFWLIPYLQDAEPVDIRMRPLEKDIEGLPKEEVEVVALAKPRVSADNEDEAVTILSQIPNVVILKVIAQIQTYVPYYYLNVDDAEGILHSVLERTVRMSVRNIDPMNISDYQETITCYLNAEKVDDPDEEAAAVGRKLQLQARQSGIRFTQLAITDARLPKKVEEEAMAFLLERIQRGKETYQATTLTQTAERLRKEFGLEGRELSDTTLVAAGLANMHVNSVHGGDSLTGSASTIANALRNNSAKTPAEEDVTHEDV